MIDVSNSFKDSECNKLYTWHTFYHLPVDCLSKLHQTHRSICWMSSLPLPPITSAVQTFYITEPWRAESIFPKYFSGNNYEGSSSRWMAMTLYFQHKSNCVLYTGVILRRRMTYYSVHGRGNTNPCLSQSSVHNLPPGNNLKTRKKRQLGFQFSFT